MNLDTIKQIMASMSKEQFLSICGLAYDLLVGPASPDKE